MFDSVGVRRERRGEHFRAGGGDEQDVFDADADAFFGDVDTRLDGDDVAGFEGLDGEAGVVDVEADVVAEAVGEVLAEGFAL